MVVLMDQGRFERIAQDGIAKITALTSLARPGLVAYNAYLGDVEVVVLGFRQDEGGGHTLTKPVAIVVDETVFDALRVDDEHSRVDGSGNDTPRKVR